MAARIAPLGMTLAFHPRAREWAPADTAEPGLSCTELLLEHVFGERTLATLERLLSLMSAFEVVVWMTDGWPLYESRLKGKLHVISKRYTQRIERHNLNLRQHLARLGRKLLSFSKSVELHDKVIGHYLNIKHYQ